jgi:hypothetical protein
LVISGPFRFHMNFGIFSISAKTAIEFDRDYIQSANSLGSMENFNNIASFMNTKCLSIYFCLP